MLLLRHSPQDLLLLFFNHKLCPGSSQATLSCCRYTQPKQAVKSEKPERSTAEGDAAAFTQNQHTVISAAGRRSETGVQFLSRCKQHLDAVLKLMPSKHREEGVCKVK